MQDNVEISRDRFDHFNEERLIYQAEEGLTEELDAAKKIECFQDFPGKANA